MVHPFYLGWSSSLTECAASGGMHMEGWGRDTHQPDELNEPWKSMQWQMSQPDHPPLPIRLTGIIHQHPFAGYFLLFTALEHWRAHTQSCFEQMDAVQCWNRVDSMAFQLKRDCVFVGNLSRRIWHISLNVYPWLYTDTKDHYLDPFLKKMKFWHAKYKLAFLLQETLKRSWVFCYSGPLQKSLPGVGKSK